MANENLGGSRLTYQPPHQGRRVNMTFQRIQAILVRNGLDCARFGTPVSFGTKFRTMCAVMRAHGSEAKLRRAFNATCAWFKINAPATKVDRFDHAPKLPPLVLPVAYVYGMGRNRDLIAANTRADGQFIPTENKVEYGNRFLMDGQEPWSITWKRKGIISRDWMVTKRRALDEWYRNVRVVMNARTKAGNDHWGDGTLSYKAKLAAHNKALAKLAEEVIVANGEDVTSGRASSCVNKARGLALHSTLRDGKERRLMDKVVRTLEQYGNPAKAASTQRMLKRKGRK